MADWYLLRNDRNMVCETSRGGCGQTHEFLTKGCRPVALKDPLEFAAYRITTVEDKAITLKSQDITHTTIPLGTIVGISQKEAEEMGCIFREKPKVSPLVISRSVPNSPTRNLEYRWKDTR